MARVYISSTVADLEAERQAVMTWLVAADHQPVHSYGPNSETVRESCLDDIDGCDLYVLILGHRYGFQPEEGNPEKLSITHLEFRRAEQSGIPRIALLRTSVPDIGLSDLLDPQRAALVRTFNDEVRGKVRPAEFHDLQGLIQGLSTGVQSELNKLQRDPARRGRWDAKTEMARQQEWAAEIEKQLEEIKRRQEPRNFFPPREGQDFLANNAKGEIAEFLYPKGDGEAERLARDIQSILGWAKWKVGELRAYEGLGEYGDDITVVVKGGSAFLKHNAPLVALVQALESEHLRVGKQPRLDPTLPSDNSFRLIISRR